MQFTLGPQASRLHCCETSPLRGYAGETPAVPGNEVFKLHHYQRGVYVLSTEYISSRQYISDVIDITSPISRFMIIPRLDKLLAKEKRTFYWLAKETGVSHTTLWRLKKGKAVGINFETLEKICRALQCQPGDILFVTNDKTPSKCQSLKSGGKA